MNPDRIQQLNPGMIQKEVGQYILYWMQGALRTRDNAALLFAAQKSQDLQRPLLVVFCLDQNYPEANLRSFTFLWEALTEVSKNLQALEIFFRVVVGPPLVTLGQLGNRANLMITEKAYLRHPQQLRLQLAQILTCPFWQIETEVVVPVERVSNKDEYSAATLRRKILPLVAFYLDLEPWAAQEDTLSMAHLFFPVHFNPLEALTLQVGEAHSVICPQESPLASLNFPMDHSVPPAPGLIGGWSQAQARWELFANSGLEKYHINRNDPNLQGQSELSPYLHFGCFSSQRLYLLALEEGGPGSEAFLEELLVRRELAFNFTTYNPLYDQYEGLPSWVKKTLEAHSLDKRDYLYTPQEWDKAQTHDPAWNAAQREMQITGKMHGYMRMYWGKKLLEWSKTPQEALKTANWLNNRYELDGRDPNGYAGTAWCLGKHDRPWGERKVFGMIRYMNFQGLKRKFDIEAYILRVKNLENPLPQQGELL